MTKNYSVRTDLALEERERFESDQVEISGVILEEDYDESSETRITRVIIETENGAKAMGKPAGTYLTLESPALADTCLQCRMKKSRCGSQKRSVIVSVNC